MFSCAVLYLQVLTIRKAQSAGVYCIGQFTSNTLIYATLAQNASYNSLTVCTLGVDLYFLPTPLHHPKKPKHFPPPPQIPATLLFLLPSPFANPFQTTRQLQPRALFRFAARRAPARRALSGHCVAGDASITDLRFPTQTVT